MKTSTIFSVSRIERTAPRRGLIGKTALVATILCAAMAQAAQNCISNGDFELPVANYNHDTGYSYNNESGNGGKPTGWTLSPNSRMGRVREGSATGRFGVLDLMGSYSLFFERRRRAHCQRPDDHREVILKRKAR